MPASILRLMLTRVGQRLDKTYVFKILSFRLTRFEVFTVLRFWVIRSSGCKVSVKFLKAIFGFSV